MAFLGIVDGAIWLTRTAVAHILAWNMLDVLVLRRPESSLSGVHRLGFDGFLGFDGCLLRSQLCRRSASR